MANDKTRLDDFKFDDFGLDDIKSPSQARDHKQERGAIQKLSTSFAEGARDAFTRPEHIRRFASAALPKGYGTAINTGYEAYRGGRELYNIAAAELRPALPAIRRATARTLPKVKSFLPKDISDRLERFSTREEYRPRSFSQEDIQNEQINSDIGDVFKVQMEYEARNRANETAERRVRHMVQDKQTMASLERIDAIQRGIRRLVDYQDQVTYRYQRKMIELQYRQTFTLRDTLRHHLTADDKKQRLLEGILHNTALPDQAKLKLSEAAHQNFRDKLINGFQQQASTYLATFTKRFQDNIKSSLRHAMSSVSMGVQMGDDAMQTRREMIEAGIMEDDDGYEQSGKMAGGWAAEAAGRLVGKKIRDRLSKNKKINGTGAKLQYGLSNIPERMNRWAQTEDDDWSAKGIATRMFKELIPRFALDTRFGSSPLLDADEAATFNKFSQKSITEIIPGWLSRIHHELAILRTGDDKIEKLSYNMDRGEFTTFKQSVKDAKRRLFDPNAIQYARSSMQSFLDHIDKDKSLSPEARSALMRQVLADTAAGRPFDPDRYSNFEQMTAELTGANKEEVKALFDRQFKMKDGSLNYEAVNEARSRVGSLRNAVPDPKKAMSVYSDVGGDEILNELGLLTTKGVNNRVDYSKIFDYILNDAEASGTTPADKSKSLREKMEEVLGNKMDSAGGRLAGMGGAFKTTVQNATRAVGNLFVSGRAQPVIDAVKLKAGEYRDQVTGAVLRGLDDIKGPVVDATGNVVLSAQDVLGGLIDDSGRKRRDIEDKMKSRVESFQKMQVADNAVASGGSGVFSDQANMAAGSGEIPNELISLNTQQVELLKVIAEILATNGVAGGGGTPPPGGFLDRLVVGSLKKGWTGVKFAGRAYAGYLRGIGAAFKYGVKGIATIATGAAGTAFEIAKGPLAGARDVYAQGNSEPSLTAAKIKRRHYQDVKTGKPIKNLKSITGPVIDISENGEMVLSQDEFDRGLFVRSPNGFVRFGLRSLGGLGKAMVGGYVGLAKLPFVAMATAARGLKTGMTMMMNDQVDVYVAGEMQRPRLRAVLMKSGKYYSAKTGRLIRGFKDIDGPIKELAQSGLKASANDVEVISEDDIKQGLVNSRGKPLRTGMQKLLGIAGGLAQGAGSLVSGVGRFYGKLVGGAFGLAGNLFGGTAKRFGNWFNPKEFGVQSKRQTEILTDIYALLNERLVKPRKIREGSWEDQAQERADRKKDAIAAAAQKDGSSKSLLSKLTGWLTGRGGEDEGDEEGDEEGGGNTTIVGGMGGGKSDNSRDARGRKRGGFRRNTSARWKRGKRLFGRSRVGRLLGGVGGKMGRFKPRGLGAGGIAAGIGAGLGLDYLIDKLGGSKTAAGKAASTGVGVAGNALTAYSLASMLGLGGGGAAATATAGTAGTAAAGVGGGALMTIGLPVALIAGAVGYAGVKGYKRYKFGTYMPLRSFRLTQYGVPYSETSQAEKIVELEQMLEPHTQDMGQGLDISAEKLSMEEIYKLFDLEDGWFSDSADKRRLFDLWFNGRFKPVYLRWMTSLKAVKGAGRLNDADDLPHAEKTKLLKAAKQVSGQAYTIKVGPFDGEPLELSTSDVEDAYLLALNAIEKGKTATGSAMSSLKRWSRAIGGVGPMGFLSDAAMDYTDKQDQKRELAALRGKPSPSIGLGAASVIGMSRIVKGMAGPAAGLIGSTVSAFKAIRMRTYGLTDMTPEIVRALLMLENDIIRVMSYDGKGAASFDMKSQQYFLEYGTYFGTSTDNAGSQARWVDWFENRFVPVVLAYASTVRALSRSVDPREAESYLKPGELVEVALSVMGAKRSIAGIKLPVWSFTASPWGNEPLNSDSKTVVDNLVALKEAVKKKNLDEDKSRAAGGKNARGSASTTEARNAEASKSSNWASSMQTWLMGTQKDPTMLGQAANAWKQIPNMISNSAVGDTYRSASGAISAAFGGGVFGGSGGGNNEAFGSTVTHPGKGTGGSVNDIPMPTGDGNWAALQNTILAAAKMAGVSPDLMATMANIESGFRASVKAGTSSATGLYQFINSTWEEMIRKHAGKYGISPQASRSDPRANALMGAEFLKENITFLKRQLGRDPTDTEMYLAHFMGAGGAGKLLSMLKSNPQANAVTAFPKQARANRSIFMNKDGSPRTIQGVMAELDNRVRRRRINAGGGSFGPIAGNLGAPKTGGLTTTTANGPMSGLGSGTGFSPVLSQLSSGSKPAFSMVPTGTPQTPAKPPISSMPAPSIDRSAGLNMLGPDASDSSAGYAAQQRRAAAVTDYRSGEAVQETSKQLSSVVEVLGKSFQVQTEILTVLRRIENKEPSKPTAVVPVPPATSTRRPPEALPAASPVSVKRNNG